MSHVSKTGAPAGRKQDQKAESARSTLRPDGSLAFSVVAGVMGLGITLLENEKAAAAEKAAVDFEANHHAAVLHAAEAGGIPQQIDFPVAVGNAQSAQQAEVVALDAVDAGRAVAGTPVEAAAAPAEAQAAAEEQAPSDSAPEAHSSGSSDQPVEQGDLAVQGAETSQPAASSGPAAPQQSAFAQLSQETGGFEPALEAATDAGTIGGSPSTGATASCRPSLPRSSICWICPEGMDRFPALSPV